METFFSPGKHIIRSSRISRLLSLVLIHTTAHSPIITIPLLSCFWLSTAASWPTPKYSDIKWPFYFAQPVGQEDSRVQWEWFASTPWCLGPQLGWLRWRRWGRGGGWPLRAGIIWKLFTHISGTWSGMTLAVISGKCCSKCGLSCLGLPHSMVTSGWSVVAQRSKNECFSKQDESYLTQCHFHCTL